MTESTHTGQQPDQAARRRRALERLIRIDDARAAADLRDEGLSQRDIATRLGITQPRVHRLLRAVENHLSETDEVLLRLTAGMIAREDAIARLVEEPLDDIRRSLASAVEAGTITPAEYETVRSASWPEPSTATMPLQEWAAVEDLGMRFLRPTKAEA